MNGLGRLQRAALALAARPEGCTTADLGTEGADPGAAWRSLSLLARRGLVRASGKRWLSQPRPGARPHAAWTATQAGADDGRRVTESERAEAA